MTNLNFAAIHFFYTCSPGSVGVEYVAQFNNTAGISDDNLRTELAGALSVSDNGTFLAGSDLKLSNETDPAKAVEALEFTGKFIYCGKQSYFNTK